MEIIKSYKIHYNIIDNRYGHYIHMNGHDAIDCNIMYYLEWIKDCLSEKEYKYTLRNINFISYAYILNEDYKIEVDDDCEYISNETLINNHENVIINELSKNGISVIGFMLTFPDDNNEFTNEGYDMLDMIGVRIRKHNIANALLEKYKELHERVLAATRYNILWASWTVNYIYMYGEYKNVGEFIGSVYIIKNINKIKNVDLLYKAENILLEILHNA